MLILLRVNCAFSPVSAVSRTRLSEFQQPVRGGAAGGSGTGQAVLLVVIEAVAVGGQPYR